MQMEDFIDRCQSSRPFPEKGSMTSQDLRTGNLSGSKGKVKEHESADEFS